jgi:hypothetical protein
LWEGAVRKGNKMFCGGRENVIRRKAGEEEVTGEEKQKECWGRERDSTTGQNRVGTGRGGDKREEYQERCWERKRRIYDEMGN